MYLYIFSVKLLTHLEITDILNNICYYCIRFRKQKFEGKKKTTSIVLSTIKILVFLIVCLYSFKH